MKKARPRAGELWEISDGKDSAIVMLFGRKTWYWSAHWVDCTCPLYIGRPDGAVDEEHFIRRIEEAHNA